MKHHLITLMFLVVAVALYIAGAALPAMLLIALGVVFEGVFWMRLFRSGKRSQ